MPRSTRFCIQVQLINQPCKVTDAIPQCLQWEPGLNFHSLVPRYRFNKRYYILHFEWGQFSLQILYIQRPSGSRGGWGFHGNHATLQYGSVGAETLCRRDPSEGVRMGSSYWFELQIFYFPELPKQEKKLCF